MRLGNRYFPKIYKDRIRFMKHFFLKMKYALQRFMYGRNGNDKLCFLLMWTYLGLWLLSIVFTLLMLEIPQIVVSVLQFIVLFYWIFRVFSRNVMKRRRECDRFFGFFRNKRNRVRDRKTHVYRKCPRCRAMLRLPKKKGKHTVCCPACRERFPVKIRRNGTERKDPRGR